VAERLNKNSHPLHSVLREIQELIAATWPARNGLMHRCKNVGVFHKSRSANPTRQTARCIKNAAFTAAEKLEVAIATKFQGSNSKASRPS
jgi:hypothetical protein